MKDYLNRKCSKEQENEEMMIGQRDGADKCSEEENTWYAL